MLIAQCQYTTVARGLADVAKVTEVRAEAHVREVILEAVRAWIAGKLEPIRTLDIGYSAAKALKTRQRIAERDKDNPKLRTYRYVEVPVTERHVQIAKLHTRDRYGREFDDNDQPIQPFVRVVLEDGSHADLPVDSERLAPPASDGEGEGDAGSADPKPKRGKGK